MPFPDFPISSEVTLKKQPFLVVGLLFLANI